MNKGAAFESKRCYAECRYGASASDCSVKIRYIKVHKAGA